MKWIFDAVRRNFPHGEKIFPDHEICRSESGGG